MLSVRRVCVLWNSSIICVQRIIYMNGVHSTELDIGYVLKVHTKFCHLLCFTIIICLSGQSPGGIYGIVVDLSYVFVCMWVCVCVCVCVCLSLSHAFLCNG